MTPLLPTPPLTRLIDRALGFRDAVKVEVTRALPVPMRDGVELLADLHRPAGPPGPRGVVLMRTPYGRTSITGQQAGVLARRGLQVLIQSTRGTFGSGGHFRPFLHEHDDGMDTLAWVREQPWCDGRVATAGMSYVGHTQWAIGPYADPPLVAMCPDITASEFTSTFYPGGAPGLINLGSWVSSIGRQERVPAGLTLIPNPVLGRRTLAALNRLPLQAADVALAGAPVAFWRDFVAHDLPGDDFWTIAEHHDYDAAAMPPTSMVTGWWDLFLPHQLADFTRLHEAGVPAQLTVGPWSHGDPPSLPTLVQTGAAWLRHYLEGDPLPPRPAPVRVFLQNADEWLDLSAWPPEFREHTWYLAPDGQLNEDPVDHFDSAPSHFVYDPGDPTPSVGGPLLRPPNKQQDNAGVEERDDVLVFTGPVLRDDLDLVGPVRAVVHVRTDTGHGDVFVRLCDVDSDGESRNVVDGIHRLRPERERPDQDGVVAVEIDLFPTGYRFARGNRLRVQVAGGAFPRYARNHGTGESMAVARSLRPIRFEVRHDAAHPSAVVLPVYR